jgi:hypothetical protein
MTETMFARATVAKPLLGLVNTFVTLALLIGGFLLSASSPPAAPERTPAYAAPDAQRAPSQS